VRKKKWFPIIVVALALGLGYGAYSLFIHSGIDSITVSELMTQVESLHGQRVSVEGKIAPGSVDWDNEAKVMRFVLTDDKQSLSAIYRGIVPDNFKPGASLIIEGKHGPDDFFEVSSFGQRRSVCNLCH
jgi:cytochrome c-type biogenesis protein CcmE